MGGDTTVTASGANRGDDGMIDVASLSDDELAAVLDLARAEYQRRRDLTAALDTTPGLIEALLSATGRENGANYVPPTGYHDAYPKGWEVSDDGAEWIATRDGARGVPGEGFDWVRKTPKNGIPIWAPVQAGSERAVGVIVSHKGRLHRNDHTGPNGWEPGTTGSQWTDIGPA